MQAICTGESAEPSQVPMAERVEGDSVADVAHGRLGFVHGASRNVAVRRPIVLKEAFTRLSHHLNRRFEGRTSCTAWRVRVAKVYGYQK